MRIFKEFREFAMKGNLIDMAVAFVMGAAFGKLVSSFIEGMVMPMIGKITTGVDFKSLKYILNPAQTDANGKIVIPEAAIRYGEFITVFIDFLLVAFVMFLLVKALNKARKKNEETAENIIKPEIQLLSEIRDLLKNK